jgi:hypothetical protein
MEPGDTGDCTPTTSSSQGAPTGSSLTTRFLSSRRSPRADVNNLVTQALIAAHVARELARFPEDELFSN